MNLNQLEYFVAVAENLSFTKAARQCFISQTAMTQQIHALEQTVGVPLFVRDKHHVMLTPAGVVYLKEARTILKRNDDAIRLARVAGEGTTGELTVGYISGFGTSDCADILRGFREAYPGISMKLFRSTMSGLFDALARGECDIALTIQTHQQEFSNIGHQYIRSYPLTAVLPAEHPLAERKNITYSDLKAENFIIMQPSARPRAEMEEMLWVYERGGFMPNVVALETEPETIMLMISLGMGISILPEYIVRLYYRKNDIRILPVVKSDGNAETLDFEMAWSEDNGNPAVKTLREWWKME